MKNQLYYTKKAKHFEEALPIGNGRIGGLVFGNLKRERIALNEDTLWSGYPKDYNKKDAYKYLDKARKAIFDGDAQRGANIVNKNMHGHWSDSYLPFGDLIINYKGVSSTDYKRTLDLQNGIARVCTDDLIQTVFVSHPSQLMVVHIQSVFGVTFSVTFESQLKNKTYTHEDSLVIFGKAPEVCMPPYYNEGESVIQGDKGMDFCGVVKVLGNAKFDDNKIIVQNQNEITLLISLATSFIDYKSMPTANAEERAYSYFKNTKDYDSLYKEHAEDFSALFNRVDFVLEGGYDDLPTDKRIKKMNKSGDDYSLVALLYQYGRYLTISASRKGTSAMNLQGIWDTHLRAPWSSNYTTNINLQMNYWCTDSANLSECFEPLVDFVEKIADNGTKTAKAYYNANGYCLHHNSDIWGMTYPAGFPNGDGDSTQYAPWSSAAPWLLNQLYEHYLYTKDEKFKEKLITLYKGCLDFYNDFLVEYNGELVTCPSISPENKIKINGVEQCLTYMPSMDREILFDFFENCKELGLNAPTIKQVSPADDGRIPEYITDCEETEIEHRHISHLYCIYPSHRVQDEKLNKAAEKSLLVRGFGGTGWSLGWKVCAWAKLKNGDNAFKLIKQQLQFVNPVVNITHHGGGSYPNLFDAHPPFQIDGNFGVCEGIALMLKNKAIPSEWHGYIRGLKDYDSKEISYNF